jgi:serine/threonine-protein kinase
MIGETIAHYTITEKIGAGGMGEVFRARDEKLNRDVALKILPNTYAADAQRMGRFQREARLLASLNHANIASIYGLEESKGTHALVLELVEGEDLSTTLRSRACSLEESLDIAVQIAEALEFAHESGVVHRDLKPANVKVTPEGKVKVLDFGLAKAFMDESSDASDPGTTKSPTLSIAASAAGVILGTAAYMSPEQARGKQVDRRADIWAFGIVLFEMLTGKQLFMGETISDTLAAVIKDDPDWNLLPATTPALVGELIRRCLAKSPRQRLQSIGEARIALEEARSGGGASSVTLLSSTMSQTAADASTQAVTAAPARRSRALLWLTSLVVVAAIAAFLGNLLGSSPRSTQARRFFLQPEGLQVSYPTQPALSPDGRRVAFFLGATLYVRDLHALESVEIPGSNAATSPFWSPDGAWLAFGLKGRIYKVAAVGGTPIVVCDVPFGTLDGAAWGDDNMLYLAPNSGPIYRVSDRGGDAEPLFPPEPGESDFHTPSTLPGGRGVVFTTHNTEGRQTIELFADGERKVLLTIPGARLEYAAWSRAPGTSSEGHLVYHRLNSNTGVWAVPFDLGTREITGDPFLLDTDGAFPSVGKDGSLLYSVGSGGGPQQLVIVNRKGEVVSHIGRPQLEASWPSVSPDGRSVLVSAMEGENRDIWLHDVERGTRTRMTFSPDADFHPNWINDGQDIVFSRGSVGVSTFRRPADGSGDPQLFVDGYNASIVDGVELMAFNLFLPDTGQDIFFRSVDSDVAPQPFLQTSASEVGPVLSPDGKHVVYWSDESGGNEIYLKSFPTGEGKWQVSTNGGAWPKWSRAGNEIIFRSGSGATARMMSVSVQTSPNVQLGTPVVMFAAADTPNLSYRSGFAGYDVTADPDRFVMLEYTERTRGPVTRLVFAENWYVSYRSEGK